MRATEVIFYERILNTTHNSAGPKAITCLTYGYLIKN